MSKPTILSAIIKLRKTVIILLFLFLIISQTGCDKKEEAGEPISKDGFFLDTICTITIYNMAGDSSSNDFAKNAEAAIDGAFSLCKEYENLLSKTIDTSDISKIHSAGGEFVECDPRTVEIIRDGIDFGYLSEGSFNIGIGTVTDLWDFHAMDPVVPDKAEIEKALEHVHSCAIYSSYMNVIIEGNKVRLEDPESKIDLGGIAKGYIADALGDYLKEQGVTGAVIDLGGNLVVIGYKDESKEDELRIGIKKPYTQSNELVGAVAVHDASVVTSGVYERYFEVDGVKYHHVLSPETGYPVETDLVSATVIGPLGHSEDCDALATSILINGKEWLEKVLGGTAFMPESDAYKDFAFILIYEDGEIEVLGNDPGFELFK